MKNPNMSDAEINDMDRLNHFGGLSYDIKNLLVKHKCLVEDVVFVCNYMRDPDLIPDIEASTKTAKQKGDWEGFRRSLGCAIKGYLVDNKFLRSTK